MKVAKYIVPLTIAFEEDVYLEIQELTDQLRISMAEFVREAVNKELVAMKSDEKN